MYLSKDEFDRLIEEFYWQLDHRICMGIRHGLYGCSASEDSNGITDGLFAISSSLDKVAEAITKTNKEND